MRIFPRAESASGLPGGDNPQAGAKTPPATSETTAASAPARLPFPALMAALTAYAALTVVARNVLPETMVLTAALLLTYVTTARLRGNFILRLLLRAGLIILITRLNPENPALGYEQLGEARYRNVAGLICATETAIQFWSATGTDPTGPLLGALMAAGMTLVFACNTFNERAVAVFTPLFFVFAALAARGYRRRAEGGSAAPSRRARRISAALHGAALVVALGLGTVVDVAVSVNRGPLTDWSNKFLARQHPHFETTGMAEQPTMGPIFDLRSSPARVLRIQGRNVDPHWRGAAFDTYVNGTWAPPMSSRAQMRGGPEMLVAPAGSRAVAETDLHVVRLVNDNPLVFAPLGTTSMDPTDSTIEMVWSPNYGGPLRTRAGGTFEYTVFVPQNARLEPTFQGLLATPRLASASAPPPSPKLSLTDTAAKERREAGNDRRRYLTLPVNDRDPDGIAGIRALALRIVKDAKARTPEAKAEAIQLWLLSNFDYSLRFMVDGKHDDPVADFLLASPKRGAHCEFFAASATLLLREVGVPSRYVTGYYAHETDGPNVTVVRQRDAHAWCEAWIDGIGWITVDATPGDGRPDAEDQSVEGWRRSYEWVQDKIQAVSDFLANLTQEQTNAALAVAVAAGFVYAGLWFYLRKRRQTRATTADSEWRYSSPEADLSEMARRFEAAWARLGGAPFPPSRTYAEYLREGSRPAFADNNEDGALTNEDAALGGGGRTVSAAQTEQARLWAARYDAARFGGHFDADARREMEQILKDWETPAKP